ncbi:MAG: hypothetical protein ACREEM_56090 [Blastocatellia bacterium]
MNLQKLEDLKAMVQIDEDFGAVWKFFFDHFGEKPEFAATGKPADGEMQSYLEPILEDICKRIANREVMIADFMLSEVPGHGFYHGPCLTDAGIVVVIYFEDVKMGMVSLTPGIGSGMVHYARFTAVPVESKGGVMLQSRGNTSH